MERRERKLAFLRQFIQAHPHPHYEVRALIHYLISQSASLDYLEFADQVAYAPRGLLIRYQDLHGQPGLTYYKESYTYEAVDQAFHDFRLNALQEKTTFYLEFDLPDFYYEALRQDVLVENPFQPLYLGDLDQIRDATLALSQSACRQMIMRQIDQALDAKNFDLVETYLGQLNQLSE